jgi:hypothetical protein
LFLGVQITIPQLPESFPGKALSAGEIESFIEEDTFAPEQG